MIYNPKCILRHSEMVDMAASADVPLNYGEVVNIQNIKN